MERFLCGCVAGPLPWLQLSATVLQHQPVSLHRGWKRGAKRLRDGCAVTQEVVSGSCAGYAKPDFQTLAGVPNDGVRDLPDVSLFAANGVWAHYYVYCFSDPNHGGSPCTGHPNTWSGGGGTSFASPIWAGIQALLNQKIKSSSGNPNYNLYSIANTDGLYLSGKCDSDSLTGPNPGCNFNDVTQGDMDIPCRGLNNCYQPSGDFYGVLSTSNSTLFRPMGLPRVGILLLESGR